MPDREAKKKTEIKKSAVSAPVEIGKPKEGSEKDIRWYVIHTYSGYENKVKDTLTRKVHSMGMDDTMWCWTCLMTEARLKLISVISAQRQL